MFHFFISLSVDLSFNHLLLLIANTITYEYFYEISFDLTTWLVEEVL